LHPLVRYWRQLRGSIHPADSQILTSTKHPFDLSFPPPAFIGDIVKAKIIVLMANGGRSSEAALAQEFRAPNAARNYLDCLHNPRPAETQFTAEYYQRGALWDHLRSGHACLINAVAYRSREVSGDVYSIADLLPSTIFHRQWLFDFALPAAATGKIAIIAKRTKLWALNNVRLYDGVFEDAPATRYVASNCWNEARAWVN
jgi:hypothetical protein